jgi:hypothetical protein
MFPAAALTPVWIERGQAHIEDPKPAPALRSPAELADLYRRDLPRDPVVSDHEIIRRRLPSTEAALLNLIHARVRRAYNERGQDEATLPETRPNELADALRPIMEKQRENTRPWRKGFSYSEKPTRRAGEPNSHQQSGMTLIDNYHLNTQSPQSRLQDCVPTTSASRAFFRPSDAFTCRELTSED